MTAQLISLNKRRSEADNEADAMEIRRGQALIRTGASLIGRHSSPQEAIAFLKELVRNLEVGAEQP